MRITTDYTFDSAEDWVLACLYLTAEEIKAHGLIPNTFNGHDYDWITLPEREDTPDADGHILVAASGGALSDICRFESCFSTLSEATYYVLPEYADWEWNGVHGEDVTYLPDALQGLATGEIITTFGQYYEDELEHPAYDYEAGWIEASEDCPCPGYPF